MNTTELSDADIVRLALKNKDSLGVLIDRYSDKLRRYIMRLGVHNADDQDDVLQEVFLKVYRYLHNFDTSLPFSSWIYRIAHNETMTWFRKRSVRPEGHLVGESEEVLAFIVSELQDPETHSVAKFDADQLRTALFSLDTKYRDSLMLRFFEGKEYEEISDILKIPVGSVGTLIHRGKDKLRQQLQQYFRV
jgi:RNA polymerase sigma-70 factor (ECF subfamily)